MNYKFPKKFANIDLRGTRSKLKGLSKVVGTGHILVKLNRPVRAYNYAGSFWNYVRRLGYE